ncbi:hypothetical protein [Anaeromyxobacter diazotrophicus]|nr:hypothetical protein [Anaeromyxobacter diazotrophicus]
MAVAIAMIVDSFDHPRAHYTILGIARGDLRDNYWDPIFKELDQRYALHATFNESSLSMTMPNGATIRLVGADTSQKEHRKLLGGKKRAVAVDECQAFGTDLRELVYGVLKPSVADYNGTVVCVGTPSNNLVGFFHDLTRGCEAGKPGPAGMREPGWSLATWSTSQNTALVDGERMCDRFAREIAQLRAANEFIEEVPWFRQNYLGQWVVETDARCYRFDPDKNVFDGTLPEFEAGRWHYTLAFDVGFFPDACAFSVSAYHDFDGRLFYVESWKAWRLDITDVAEKVKAYQKRYDFDSIVLDGSNLQLVEELRRRHDLPLVCAKKPDKGTWIDLFNAECIAGRIKFDLSLCNQGVHKGYDPAHPSAVQESLSVADEYAGLIWNERKLRETGKREELASCPNHLADSCLYNFRHTFQYLATPEPKRAKMGTKAWFDQHAEEEWQREMDEMNERLDGERRGLEDVDPGNIDPRFIH